ncbi:D-serine ammonia-lyase [Mesobacillus maritimus]|uniref:Probable D-serine dehydratase n=1 Tax=Mesobacillus maritimus TaxID=1643336 RepID=A0ABS7K1L7_9BACI|nr:D-serine ammonia-lyase [Mesobacillus maritimus]MBY0096148.1 D-serine ammonia-lyase [Mesobacillus maritimus]
MRRELHDLERFPLISELGKKIPVFWQNPDYQPNVTFPIKKLGPEIITDAKDRLHRFEPVLKWLFPEMENGIVSPITELSSMKKELEAKYHSKIDGRMFLKRDDVLPVAGSIKARGGFHEVLAYTETLAIKKGLISTVKDDYQILVTENARKVFSQYTISVGSTGNLGLSIGMIGSALGFRVVVHMSVDAKEWKKDLLRKHGVKVVEHPSDYSEAVEQARNESDQDAHSYFVDDEQSPLLFAGYAAAAFEVKTQLAKQGVEVSADHPLNVYLPCGVGGGPGGVAFGLKHVFGEHVHCFFAEPTHSPCMLLGLMTKLHHQISVGDIGLDNRTEADGLAVGRASSFVGEIMENMLSGVYTISDDELLSLLFLLHKSEGTFLEPSSLAGMKGPVHLSKLNPNANHLVWGTGGSLVPEELRADFIKRGKHYDEKNW